MAMVSAVTTLVGVSPAIAQVGPTTYVVDSTADDGTGSCTTIGAPCTLRSAIESANAAPGSTVVVPAGSYVLSNGELDVAECTVIEGAAQPFAPDATIIDGAGGSRVFDVSAAGVVISGVTVTGGDTNQTGGGIRVSQSASLVLRDSWVTANTARQG